MKRFKLKKNNTYTALELAMDWSSQGPTHYGTRANVKYVKLMEKRTKLNGLMLVPIHDQSFQLVGPGKWLML